MAAIAVIAAIGVGAGSAQRPAATDRAPGVRGAMVRPTRRDDASRWCCEPPQPPIPAIPAKVIRKGRFFRLPTRLIEAISAAPKNVDERSSKCRLF